jgi:hypothetical protein
MLDVLALSTKGIHTLMGDLEDRPQHLVLLLALVRRILGVFHLVGELEQGVFNVVEALWRRLTVAGCAERRHGCCLVCGLCEIVGEEEQAIGNEGSTVCLVANNCARLFTSCM